MSQRDRQGLVPADPSQWSPASQRSISFHYIKEYRDIAYRCWRCKAEAVFFAEDQKYTYEVKKAPIDQQRILCNECWKQRNMIEAEIENCRECWASDKVVYARDREFLRRWLQLLVSRGEYVPYHPDVATKRMLEKLLAGPA